MARAPSPGPLHHLPTELLEEIFLVCQRQDAHGKISRYTAPFSISHTCTAWRSIALSLSSLWASLNIKFSLRDSPPHMQLITLWLQRSGAQLLSLYLEVDEYPPVAPDWVRKSSLIVDLFGTVADRWKSINLIIPGSYALLKTVASSGAPHLETLVLTLRDWTLGELEDVNELFRCAPSLKSITWNQTNQWSGWDAPVPDFVELLSPPWHQLTCLVLYPHLTFQTAYHTLSHCPNLIECEFRQFAGGIAFANQMTRPVITLRYLRSFASYQKTIDASFGALLDLLYCPSLLSISVTYRFVAGLPQRWPQTQFHSFLSRASCALEQLLLEFTGITETDLISLLELCTDSLARLTVSDRETICVSAKLITMLTPSSPAVSQSTPICPRLRELVLDRVIQCPDGMFANMLESRQVHGIPLEHVDAQFSYPHKAQNPSDMAVLRNLRRRNEVRLC